MDNNHLNTFKDLMNFIGSPVYKELNNFRIVAHVEYINDQL